MSQNRESHKKHWARGTGPNRRKYLFLLMRIVLVILQLLIVAAHRDTLGVHDEAAAHAS